MEPLVFYFYHVSININSESSFVGSISWVCLKSGVQSALPWLTAYNTNHDTAQTVGCGTIRTTSTIIGRYIGTWQKNVYDVMLIIIAKSTDIGLSTDLNGFMDVETESHLHIQSISQMYVREKINVTNTLRRQQNT